MTSNLSTSQPAVLGAMPVQSAPTFISTTIGQFGSTTISSVTSQVQ